METTEIINIIMFGITAISVLFAVFFYFKNPQEKLDKKQAINEVRDEERDKNKATVLQQKEAESKATLLAEQVKWDKEANEKKFLEMGIRIDKAFEVAQNHINTIETEVKNQTVSIGALTNKMTELTTIISERLPCKNL